MGHDATKLAIGSGPLTLTDLRRIDGQPVEIELAPQARARMEASSASLQRMIDAGRLVYGVNTGSGPLAGTAIDADLTHELQRRMLLSNAAGVGPPLPANVVRRIMVLKLATLARGASGVRPALADALIALLNAGIHPRVPAQGSCGASGDLAPLAHIGVALLGIGEVEQEGRWRPAADALQAAGLEPFVPGPKEGLAIVNGTQASTALAIEGLFRAEDGLAAALCAGAISLEAGSGTIAALDERIHALRDQVGQADVAQTLRQLLADSPRQADGAPRRVQDPYCLRCMPQVIGAALDQIRSAADILAREANAVTDNPLIDAERDEVLYGGNFHAQPVGLAADTLALAIAEIGSMSERRTAFLVDGHMSGLPDFLVAGAGLDSGFMVAQVTAAALASENKGLAHPASTDSLPTAANQEDYVSMATRAARRLGDMTANLANIIAIELLAACQGLDHADPERSGPHVRQLHAAIRAQIPSLDEDRFLAPDIETVARLVEAGTFHEHLPEGLPPVVP